MSKLKQAKTLVREILEKYEWCKDDDRRLTSNIWALQLSEANNGAGYNWANNKDFMQLYATGRLMSATTIKRARAKLQEMYPHLRGKKYAIRQSKYAKTWEEDLGYAKGKFITDEIGREIRLPYKD